MARGEFLIIILFVCLFVFTNILSQRSFTYLVRFLDSSFDLFEGGKDLQKDMDRLD